MTYDDECWAERTFADPHHPCRCRMSSIHIGVRHECSCGRSWIDWPVRNQPEVER